MERLSDNAIAIINDLHTERLAYQSEYIPLIDAANRLADYEDTGLEPEEIEELRGEMITCYDESGVAYHVSADGSEAKHIVDLLMAESQGRLGVLERKSNAEKI